MLKRSLLFFMVAVFLLSSSLVFAAGEKGEDANKKLMDGSKRFVSGNLAQKDIGDLRRKELTKGQYPFAIVVACSDSRVGPELIFDQGLGELFVVRVAGNVLDPISLGSIEYAAEHLHAPLLILLGHTQCGAVIASVDAKGKPKGNIGAIVKKILPAVDKAKAKGGSKQDIINNSIKENVLVSESYMLKNSPIIKNHVDSGKLKVVKAIYNLSSGEVEVIGK